MAFLSTHLCILLAYNAYGVCGAVSSHEAKLHVINAHLLS